MATSAIIVNLLIGDSTYRKILYLNQTSSFLSSFMSFYKCFFVHRIIQDKCFNVRRKWVESMRTQTLNTASLHYNKSFTSISLLENNCCLSSFSFFNQMNMYTIKVELPKLVWGFFSLVLAKLEIYFDCFKDKTYFGELMQLQWFRYI